MGSPPNSSRLSATQKPESLVVPTPIYRLSSGPQRMDGVEDLALALLNSREFLFNH